MTGRGAAPLARYDFRQVPGASADAEVLKAAHAAFAARLAGKLADALGRPVEARFQFAETLRYDEFVYSLPSVSCLSVFRVDPPNAQCCMDLGLALVHRMIDRLLAGSENASAQAAPDRPLTRIEQTMILPVLEMIFSSLAEAYDPAGMVSVREESLESSAAELRIMPSDETITAVRFDLSFNGVNGRLSLALPAPVTQMLCDPSATPPPPVTRQEREAQRQDVAGNLLAASVELRAVLAETRLRLDEVLTLHEGDIIMTNRAAAAGLEARLDIQGRQRFGAEPGALDGLAAVAITDQRAAASSPDRDGRSRA